MKVFFVYFLKKTVFLFSSLFFVPPLSCLAHGSTQLELPFANVACGVVCCARTRTFSYYTQHTRLEFGCVCVIQSQDAVWGMLCPHTLRSFIASDDFSLSNVGGMILHNCTVGNVERLTEMVESVEGRWLIAAVLETVERTYA